MKAPWTGLRWCAPIAGLLLLATACGGSDSADLDQSLVKKVRSGFNAIEHADGATTRVALSVDTGSSTKQICMVVRSEVKAASPNGERVALSYLGDDASISSDGTCTADEQDTRELIVDGSYVYVQDDAVAVEPGSGDCATTYERSKISEAAAAELGTYADDTATSKISKLLKVTKNISEDGSDIVIELDPGKAISEFGDDDVDVPDDASATMTVTFATGNNVSGVDLAVGAGDVEFGEHVRYEAVGQPQHVTVPDKSCVEDSGDTVDSTSEILSKIGLG